MNITKVKIERVLDVRTPEKDINKMTYRNIKWFEIDNKDYWVSEFDIASYMFNRIN